MIRDTFFSAPPFCELMSQRNGGELEGKFAPLRNDVRYNGDCFRMERIFPV